MPSIERTLTVHAPLERVWAYLTDFVTTEEWDPPTVSTTLASGDGAVGRVSRHVSKILGPETETRSTVVEREPMRLCRLEGKASSMTMLDTMEFEEIGDRTRVT